MTVLDRGAPVEGLLSQAVSAYEQAGGESIGTDALARRTVEHGIPSDGIPQDFAADPMDSVADDVQLATALTMPLRGSRRSTVAVLALGSGRTAAFGETALATLLVVEVPAALVLENALPAARVSATDASPAGA